MPTLADIAALLGTPAPAHGERNVRGVATIDEATPDDLTFVSSETYARQLPKSRAMGVIVHRKVKLPPDYAGVTFAVDDADLAVAKVLELLAPPIPRPAAGVDLLARVASSAQISDGAAIGPFVFVGERSRVGARTVLHPGAYVGDDVVIGEDCQLFPQVVVRERITIGNRVII